MPYQTSTNHYQNTKFIVSSAGDSPYSTIQAAINAANTAGGNAVVFIRPGAFTENLTLYTTVDICGADTYQVAISGIHTPPVAGNISISNVSLISATHAFNSAAAGTTTIILSDVLTDCTNGYTLNLPNWGSGDLYISNVTCSGNDDGFLNNTGDISLLAENSVLGNGTGNTLIANGEIEAKDCEFGCPITITGSSTSTFKNTKFLNNIDFTVGSAAYLTGCFFDTGANIPISYNSTADIYFSDVTINTSNTTAMNGTGAGTVNMGVMDFLDGSSIENLFTVAYSDTLNTNAHGWNGSFIEAPAITVTAAGGVITCSVEKAGGGNLTLLTHRGYYHWDTTPADTVTLTAGIDTAPQINYVYFLGSTKTLTASTTGFPAAGHGPLATVLCQSAASLQTDGAYKVHAWTDHIAVQTNVGHIGHINSWIRHQNATWASGVVQTYTITPQGGAADNVTIETTSGLILQLHDHTFPSFTNPNDYYVVNDSVTPYTIVTDLNSLLTDSAGGAMAGRYFALVLWGVVSENTGDCKFYINLPSGSYNSATRVTADDSKYANFAIPAEFKGTGFLISQWNLKHSAAASGTWTSIDEVDLRGFIPGVSAGTGTAASTEFPDNTFRIFDDGDATKEIAFQASGITPANTRTMTVQDSDGTIAYTNVANYGTGVTTLTDHGVLVGSGTAPITPLAEAASGELIIGSTGADPALAALAAPAAGITITGGAGSITFALADDLAAVEGIGTTGVASRTGANTWSTSSITQNALLYGSATEGLTNLGPLTNGQLIIGSTGAAPVAGALASADASVTITLGAGTVDLSVPGGGVDQVSVIYVGKHGNDGNDGKTEDKAKLTFAAAITAAAAATPSSVICLDAGVYTEALTLQSSVDVFAPEAELTGSVTGADNSSIKLRTLNVADTSTGCVKVAGTGYCLFDIDEVICAGSGNAFYSSVDNVHVKFVNISVVTGYALIVVTGSINFLGGDIDMSGAGYCIAVSSTGALNGKLNEINAASGTGILGQTGSINVMAEKIVAAQGLTISSGNATLTCNLLTGTTTGITATGGTMRVTSDIITGGTTSIAVGAGATAYVHANEIVGAKSINATATYRQISAEDGCITPFVECAVASGDPYTLYSIGGTNEFVAGVDDTDGDSYKINQGGATPSAGTNILKIKAAGDITFNNAYEFPIADGNANEVLITDGGGNVDWGPAAASGEIIQVVEGTIATTVTVSTQIPYDDTIPQITEGTEVITVAITPSNVNNKLLISFGYSCRYSFAATRQHIFALFQDSTANALFAGTALSFGNANTLAMGVHREYMMTAGTTSSTTIRLRAGSSGSGSTFIINGDSGGRTFGGVSNAYIRIMEINA